MLASHLLMLFKVLRINLIEKIYKDKSKTLCPKNRLQIVINNLYCLFLLIFKANMMRASICLGGRVFVCVCL